MKYKKTQKGSVLAFSLLTMAIVLIIAVGMMRVSSIEQVASGTTDDSAIAFQMADTGAERVFHKLLKESVATLNDVGPCSAGTVTQSVSGAGSYRIIFFDQSGDKLTSCADPATDVRSAKIVGSFGRAVRAVHISVSVFEEVTDGLLAHWTFDDGSGPLADDTAGASNDHDGYITSPTWSTNALRGTYALEFNGTNTEVTVRNDDDFAFGAGDSVTFSVWARPSTTSGDDVVLSKSLDNAPGYGLWRNGNTWRAVLGTVELSGGTAASDQWHHIVLYKDGTEARLYVDGVQVDTATVGAINGDGIFYIGDIKGSAYTTVGQWDGLLDDLRVYERALSDEEILTLCRQRRDGGTCG